MEGFETVSRGADYGDGNDQGYHRSGNADGIEEFRPSLIFGCEDILSAGTICRRRLAVLRGGGEGWEATGVGLVGGVFVGWGRVEGHVQGHYRSDM